MQTADTGSVQGVPVLRYTPPPGFYRSAIAPPDDFSSSEVNASLQVYPFRPFGGEIVEAFQQTLLRDWIDPRYQEGTLAGPPQFQVLTIPGAQAALSAIFGDAALGLAHPRVRLLMVAGGAAAIVDASAYDLTSWQRSVPAFNAVVASLRVDRAPPPPAVDRGPGEAGSTVAGLYLGAKPKYVVDLNRPVGFGRFLPALHFYLFSTGGRVYRAYDQLEVPAAGPDAFDFDAAQQVDPENSGRYTVQGDRLEIQMGAQAPRIARVPRRGRLEMDGVVYLRQ